MTSLPYARLGPYAIVERLGAGGMGEVYLARDTRLDRQVALKVLPPHLSGDPERRRRLEREARLVSRLNHPRICQIYDVGHDSGVDYLVMEYLRGETLAARLERGPLPLRELFKIALEVGEGLEAAHHAGLIHRDLKPANIALTADGAKLLDFSIARLTEADAESRTGPSDRADAAADVSRTRDATLTGTGIVLGSPPYMAPEQLQGGAADARSDVFALGATLFEMATGRRAFEAPDRTSSMEAVLHHEVPLITELRPRAPAGLAALIRRCLEKDPERRWPDAGAVRAELERVATEARRLSERPARRRRAAWLGAAGVTALGLVGLGLWRVGEALRPAPPPLRALIGAPDSTRFVLWGDTGGPPVLSPDGSRLAFVAVDVEGTKQVWIRPLDSQRAERVPGTEDARFPFWSPDGHSIAFFTVSHLVRVDLDTGRRTEVCAAPSARGGSWGSRGTIVFAPMFRAGIHVVPATGGTPRELIPRDTVLYTTFRWPHFLPDGRQFIYLAARHWEEWLTPREVRSDSGPRAGVFLASLDHPRPRLLRATEGEALVAGDRLLFTERGRLMAQRLRLSSGTVVDEPSGTGEHVYMDTTTWRLNATVSRTGTLAYDDRGPQTGFEMLWLDRGGNVIGRTGSRGDHVNLRLSPDGRRLAAETHAGNLSEIVVWELERNTSRRIAVGRLAAMPCWSLDGRGLFLGFEHTTAIGVRTHWQPLDAASPPRPLPPVEDNAWPEDVDPLGRVLFCASGGYNVERAGKLVLYPLAFDRQPHRKTWNEIVETRFASNVDRARISPDGRWFAYTMREAGREEVFLSPFRPDRFPAAGQDFPRVRVSRHGGSRPRWRADGRELFYVRGHSALIAVTADLRADPPAFGPEQELFRVPQRPSRNSYDVFPDGQRFIVITLGQEREAPITVVSNWLPSLDRRR